MFENKKESMHRLRNLECPDKERRDMRRKWISELEDEYYKGVYNVIFGSLCPDKDYGFVLDLIDDDYELIKRNDYEIIIDLLYDMDDNINIFNLCNYAVYQINSVECLTYEEIRKIFKNEIDHLIKKEEYTEKIKIIFNIL